MRAHCRVCEQGWRATSTDSSLLLCHYVKEQKCDLSGLSCSSSRSVWVIVLVSIMANTWNNIANQRQGRRLFCHRVCWDVSMSV